MNILKLLAVLLVTVSCSTTKGVPPSEIEEQDSYTDSNKSDNYDTILEAALASLRERAEKNKQNLGQ